MARELHLGVVGLGHRGKWNTRFICTMENIHIDIICDVYEDRMKDVADFIEEKCGYRPKETVNYADVLAEESVEAVMIFSSWEAHIPQAVAAMKAGKWAAIEVGGAYSVDQCWELVHTYEETGMPVMFLENCCYGKRELMVANMVRRGALGKVVHCEGGYRHDLRDEVALGEENRHYRLRNYRGRNCHNYPTHDFGPIAKILGINRGNRPLSLVSVASKSFGIQEWIKTRRPEDEKLNAYDFAQGDIVTTIITCAGGETVTLTLDTSLPRYYSRGFVVQGTKGMYDENSDSIFLEGRNLDHNTSIKNHCGSAADFDYEFLSPLWRPENAANVKGGHGGMDGFCFSAFFDCLQRGDKNVPIDAYDAATWMAITALSEESIANGGMPVAFPDFTNGAWLTRKPFDCDDFTQIVPEKPEEKAEDTEEE